MNDRINRIASVANLALYDDAATREYVDGAPHIKHASLRSLYGSLVTEVFDAAAGKKGDAPDVLDSGAGEGSVTLPFLELGARVTAVDIAEAQLRKLKERCSQQSGRLHVVCEDVNSFLRGTDRTYDIVVANSFLHHVPDYLGLIRLAAARVAVGGTFFSFQDPMRYDTVGGLSTVYEKWAYLWWRLFRGDVIGGLVRRFRRARGIYHEDSVHDNTEYHGTRNGVDQNAIAGLFQELGFECRIVRYYSTQSPFYQMIGERLRLKNTFAVIATRS